jgi:hypothetical protein
VISAGIFDLDGTLVEVERFKTLSCVSAATQRFGYK